MKKNGNLSITDKEKLKAWRKLFFGKTINVIAEEINESYLKDSDYVLVLVKKNDYDQIKNLSMGKYYISLSVKVGSIGPKELDNLKNPENL